MAAFFFLLYRCVYERDIYERNKMIKCLADFYTPVYLRYNTIS